MEITSEDPNVPVLSLLSPAAGFLTSGRKSLLGLGKGTRLPVRLPPTTCDMRPMVAPRTARTFLVRVRPPLSLT